VVTKALGGRIEATRLSRNITQADLAREAGVSLRTITRLESGEHASLDTFIRVLRALGLEDALAALIPDPAVRPVERVRGAARQRRRARKKKNEAQQPWAWADVSKS
jgi:transcriptional regulator with XRE-family HTH domain